MSETTDPAGAENAPATTLPASKASSAADWVRQGSRTGWDATQHAGSRLRDLAGDAYTKGDRAVRAFGQRIGAHPLAGLLGAGAVGYVAGLLVRPRR